MTESTSWKVFRQYGAVEFHRPTLKKFAWDIPLKTGGALIGYGVGALIGEGMDYVPYLNEWLPQAVQYISNIPVSGDLDGVMGLVFGFYGFGVSGIKLDDKNEADEAVVMPAHFNLKKLNEPDDNLTTLLRRRD